MSQFSRFLLMSEHAIHVKIWKWLKLLNSISFIKKTLEDQFYIRIWSFRLTFTALQLMTTNFKISQFEDFFWGPGMRFWCEWNFNFQFSTSLLRPRYALYVKFSEWLKLLNSFSIHQENTFKSSLHLNLIISTDFHSITVNDDKLQN